MSTTTDYFVQAELSLAAYSQLYGGISTNDYINALIDQGRGMSTDQAAHFAQTYSVAAQYSDSTGLSATVFADTAGNTYLAIRGTNSVNDVITDAIDIALFGTTAFQSQYASLKTKVNEWLANGTLSQTFTVTGHSLGGFLATGIAADFATNVSHAYLYNSPRIKGVSIAFHFEQSCHVAHALN